ncbi:hypothetical protein M513_04181 [Trichuris suis]|uniref:Uncharacterized protein n=1 Tax=Trichuris suis TaxID=68888 RepID=A0A085MCQ3_9BILA|nr:hypothetical protein M513_04181 [Trichuris suis]
MSSAKSSDRPFHQSDLSRIPFLIASELKDDRFFLWHSGASPTVTVLSGKEFLKGRSDEKADRCFLRLTSACYDELYSV